MGWNFDLNSHFIHFGSTTQAANHSRPLEDINFQIYHKLWLRNANIPISNLTSRFFHIYLQIHIFLGEKISCNFVFSWKKLMSSLCKKYTGIDTSLLRTWFWFETYSKFNDFWHIISESCLTALLPDNLWVRFKAFEIFINGKLTSHY